jgi:hypothetical protein
MTNGSHVPKPSMAVAVAISILITLMTGAIAQTVPPDFPAAIMCYAPTDQSWRVGYLSRVNNNGDAIYLGASGRLSATVNAKGIILAPTNRPGPVDCYGKTLDEMRSNGRTMEFQRTK